MRTISAIVGLATLLLTAPLMKANALTVQIDVAANGGLKALPYAFVFTSKNHGGLIHVAITVAPRKKSLSPGLLARLHLMDDKTNIGIIPLEETREDGKVTYWFEITPALLAKSRFEFDIMSGKEERLPNGKTRFIAIPGTIEYMFNIRDYVATKTAARPVEVGRRRGGA